VIAGLFVEQHMCIVLLLWPGNENEVTTYEVLFDEEFLGGVSIRYVYYRCSLYERYSR
jgi:hypothetical protein